MEARGQRRITIGQVNMADKKGQYSSPSIEPEGCAYVRTCDDGHLRENEPGKLDYDDFDLYHNYGEDTYSYRFWRRHIDAQKGKETSRSYAARTNSLT